MANVQKRKNNNGSSGPLLYAYDLRDLSGEQYGQILEQIFHSPDWSERMDKRNRFFASIASMNTSQLNAASIQLEKMDQALAVRIYRDMASRAMKQDHLEKQGFNECLSQLDLTREGVKERKEAMAVRFNTLTFLIDMIEGIMVDVDSDMRFLFNGKVEFQQYNGVIAALQQIRTACGETRDQGNEEEQALFVEYAESIESFINKRMKTFIAKYRFLKSKGK